jgi:hypothetical protein
VSDNDWNCRATEEKLKKSTVEGGLCLCLSGVWVSSCIGFESGPTKP